MSVTFISATSSPVLSVLGEELRPLPPAGEGLSMPNGALEVFDGDAWSEAPAGTCVTVPAYQWHSYRNGSVDCRFLTITGPGRAREFFESSAAELTSPPDMEVALALAARHDVEAIAPS